MLVAASGLLVCLATSYRFSSRAFDAMSILRAHQRQLEKSLVL